MVRHFKGPCATGRRGGKRCAVSSKGTFGRGVFLAIESRKGGFFVGPNIKMSRTAYHARGSRRVFGVVRGTGLGKTSGRW